jgi:serine/threonine protein phosphatase PrpC
MSDEFIESNKNKRNKYSKSEKPIFELSKFDKKKNLTPSKNKSSSFTNKSFNQSFNSERRKNGKNKKIISENIKQIEINLSPKKELKKRVNSGISNYQLKDSFNGSITNNFYLNNNSPNSKSKISQTERMKNNTCQNSYKINNKLDLFNDKKIKKSPNEKRKNPKSPILKNKKKIEDFSPIKRLNQKEKRKFIIKTLISENNSPLMTNSKRIKFEVNKNNEKNENDSKLNLIQSNKNKSLDKKEELKSSFHKKNNNKVNENSDKNNKKINKSNFIRRDKKINTIKEKEIKFNKKNEKKIAFSPVKQNLGVRSKSKQSEKKEFENNSKKEKNKSKNKENKFIFHEKKDLKTIQNDCEDCNLNKPFSLIEDEKEEKEKLENILNVENLENKEKELNNILELKEITPDDNTENNFKEIENNIKEKLPEILNENLDTSNEKINIKKEEIQELKIQEEEEKKSELFPKLLTKYLKKGYSPMNPKPNQDTLFIKNLSETCLFLGVCDGHGVVGHEVATFVQEELPLMMEKTLPPSPPTPSFVTLLPFIISSFKQTNDKISLSPNLDSVFSGSTCCSLLIYPNKIISCNLGDSRAILGIWNNNKWYSENLTNDHKPNIPKEKKRIEDNGGSVKSIKDKKGLPFGPERVWKGNENFPGLAMTRSFGDEVAHGIGVISVPEIKERELCGNEKFFVVASDGVWEFIDTDECVNILGKYYFDNDIKGAAKFLCEESRKRWIQEDQIIDDISIVIGFY